MAVTVSPQVENLSPNVIVQFPNQGAEFVYVRTYARWLEEEKRRETWGDTVRRYLSFIYNHLGKQVPKKVYRHIDKGMRLFGVMPSMRTLWSAGPAAVADNMCCYNCSYQNIDKVDAFAEALYILMCGCGYGFSIEQEHVSKLPIVETLKQVADYQTHTIDDSRGGWADSVKLLMNSLYEGYDVVMDYSEIRAKGSRLVTMGGRASGPEPLVCLHQFMRETFNQAQGRQLTSLECHDIINEIGEIVVAGGVRRSSEISLSDLNDEEMATAKQWPFPRRRNMANNSAVYNTKPTAIEFLKEWSLLASSGTGERGIFNRQAVRDTAPVRRHSHLIMGTNPCGEIALRSEQLCNLSEVVVRPDDDLDMMFKKVETAVWMGVIQSTFTYFPYVNDNWAKNCEEERLLGVSITGQMDAPNLMTPDALRAMKHKALKVSRHAANILNINESVSITCVKPSGTVSQVVNSSSGMHSRYSQYYIRRYRISGTDPLLHMLRDQGFDAVAENGEGPQDWLKASIAKESDQKGICPIYLKDSDWSASLVRTWVLSFPVAAPEGCITRSSLTAIEQLEYYKILQAEWCEHSTSCTVYVKDTEWFDVGNWVLKNWDYINGVSFLPYDSGKYVQAPYEEISESTYRHMSEALPQIDWSQLSTYEVQDQTTGAKSFACTGDKCDIP